MLAARAGAASAPIARSRSWISASRSGSAASGFREQREPLGVALQHRVEQARLAGRRFLLHPAEARARRQADLAAIDGEVAGDRLQQGGLAGAVAPDQADAAPSRPRSGWRRPAACGRRCGW